MKQETLDLLTQAEAEEGITWAFSSDLTIITKITQDAFNIYEAIKSGNDDAISTAQESLGSSIEAWEEWKRRNIERGMKWEETKVQP
jgi:hypothetical protein